MQEQPTHTDELANMHVGIVDIFTLNIFSIHYSANGRKWNLLIQKTPQPAILLRGEMPTEAEMKEALAQTNLPIWTIDMFMVLASVADRFPAMEG
jgi:hypothetical protein